MVAMSRDVRIALDAMGGDFGPSVVVPAAAIALERRPDMRFLLCGREDEDRAAAPNIPGCGERARSVTARSRSG